MRERVAVRRVRTLVVMVRQKGFRAFRSTAQSPTMVNMPPPKGRATRKPDEGLIQRILSDPEEGWKEFLSQYEHLLKKIIGRFDLGTEDREEAYQEISYHLVKDEFKVLRSWDSKRCSLSHYLAVVSIHTVINFTKSHFHAYALRKLNADCPEPANEEIAEEALRPTYSPAERLQRVQVLEWLEESLERWVRERKISPVDRLLVAFRLSGLSYQEIATTLGISPSYATLRFSRLRPLLKHGLEDAAMGPSEVTPPPPISI